MKSRLASVRTGGGLNRVDRAVQLLEDEWQRHGEVQLERFWAREQPPGAVDSAEAVGLLAELVKTDLRCRFAAGQTPTAAAYLERFPALRATDSRVLSLVYEEYCLNEERGTAPEVDSFCNRYPEWKSSLASQLQYHRFFSQAAGRRPALPCFPQAGEDFEEFHLQAPLGQGGASRVFLASDLSLGGKQVVLKVTLDRGQEPKVQGPLDHPHIVPANSVVYQTHGELCALSMPYRPGLPLDQVITRVDPGARPRQAIAFWHAIASGATDPSSPLAVGKTETEPHGHGLPAGPRGDGWEGFPVRGTYSQGVAWIVMILARALHYAHGKRTFHRDVKPGNVLLTLQNGPQLLDFNLAESPHSADHARVALHGGTLPYMAPEQIEAFTNPELWDKVGARADIYSLGLVLRELLTGQKPQLPDPALPPARALRAVLDRRPLLDVDVRRFNPEIPHSLQAIVAKCLALLPEKRYADAHELEQDLDRFLKFQPLPHFANPSRRERLTNWAMRHRRVLTSAACSIVVAALVYGLWHTRPVNLPAPPAIEASLAFHAALSDIKSGQFNRAFGTLSGLQEQDPSSGLIEFYLSMALNEDVKKRSEADTALRRAFATPNFKRILTAWGKGHVEVRPYLVDFADSRMKRTDLWAERRDNGSPDLDEELDTQVRRASYQLARDALELACALDPGNRRTQRLLARTERFFRQYAPAYARLSTLISSINADARPDLKSLFDCCTLRVWVSFLWAEHELREEGPVNEETRRRLLEARDDLGFCHRYLWSRPYQGIADAGNDRVDDQTFRLYHALHDRVRATVTLAEVELELSRLVDAKQSLGRAAKWLDRLNDYVKSNKLNGKVPSPDDLAQRLRHGLSRLPGEGVVNSHAPHRAEVQPADSGSGGQ